MMSPSGSVVPSPSNATGAPVTPVAGASMSTTGAAARAVAGTITMLLSATTRAARDVRDRASLQVARSGRYYGAPSAPWPDDQLPRAAGRQARGYSQERR